MKILCKVVLGLMVMLSAGWVRAAGGFEGEVDMKMTTHNGKEMDAQYFIKGHKVRSQMDTETDKGKFSGGSIYDWETKQMVVFMDQQKMYMVSQLHPEKFHYGNDKHFKITRTGKTLTILGRTCQEWDYTSDDDSGKVWMTPGIGNWWGMQMAGQSDKLPAEQRALIKMVVDEKLFPMKWESDDKSGNLRGGAEVTSVEKKSLDSAMFQPPAGYKKFDMGNLFNRSNQSSGPSDSSQKKDAVGDALKSKLPF